MTPRRGFSFAAAAALGTFVANGALAVPVVAPGGKPGAAASWRAAGGGVLLDLAPGFEASEVAKAIQATVKGANARVENDDVLVSGVPEAQLLVALEKVDVGEPSDDVDAMLANLRGGGEEEGSGSSIRATQAADFSDVLGKKEELVTAKVVEVKRQRFPLVFVTVKVASLPKGVVLAGVKAGSKITVLPRVKSRNGIVDPGDATSKLNVGAWYAQPGDTVRLRLEPEAQDDVWVAAAFERTSR